MKKFFAEFKEFIAKGDVMSMAVGIVVGAAFTAIVTSLVNDIITPIIGVLIGGLDFSSLSVNVGQASIKFGSFISAIINFLITAFVLFLVVRAFNRMTEMKDKLKKKEEEEAAAAEEPAVDPQIELLTEIRDLLKK